MKRLFLLRHAKAEAAAPGQDDRDRGLTARGLADAAAMARYLRQSGARPHPVLVSPSARTCQTARAVLDETESPDIREALYLAEPGKILALLQALPDAAAQAMVIGHNPGLEVLAALLARGRIGPKGRARRDLLEEKFPTGALAVLDFALAHWRELAPGQGVLAAFVRPKDLA